MNNTICQKLRTVFLVFMATWTLTLVRAQAQMEYFIDEDPGLGLATPIDLSEDETMQFAVPTTGLSPGSHIIGMRAYNTVKTDDVEGSVDIMHYGPTVIRDFVVLHNDVPQEILYAEYFWDEDPGYGKGTALSISVGGELDLSDLQISTDGLEPGNHTFGFRTFGSSGWSPTIVSNVDVMEQKPPQEILYAEYFWDEDPGYGKGTALSISVGDELDLSDLQISTDGLEPGNHTFGFRTFGSSGWSPTIVSNVDVMEQKPPQEILYAEYFWDDDPGYGKAMPIEIEADAEISLDNIKFSTYKLEPGSHIIGFRTYGTTGWGPTVINNVEVMEYNEAQEIIYAEYFFDEDPGYGNGIPIEIEKDQQLTIDNIELPTDQNYQLFGIRTLGTTGWSPTMIICADANIYCNDIEAVRVPEVTLPVKMQNGALVAQLELTLCLPEGVTIAKDNNNLLRITATNRLSGYNVTATKIDNQTFHITAIPTGESYINIGDGNIFNVRLQISDDAPTGYQDVVLSQISVSNEYGMVLTRPDAKSKLHIIGYPLGDVNHDGNVTLIDILMTVDYILGLNPDGFFFENADVTFDESISLADILGIVDIILGTADIVYPANMHQMQEETAP